MKKTYLLLGGLFVLVLVGAIIYQQVAKPYMDDRMVTAVVQMPVENRDLDFAFSYPSGEAGYTLIEPPIEPTEGGLRKVYILMDTQDYIAFSQEEGPTDSPPSVSVFVLPAPEQPEGQERAGRITRLQQWAEANPQLSSFPQMTTEPEVIELDGVQAIRYRTDGLYEQTVYLALHRGNIYLFTGQSDGEGDIAAMFDTMMGTVLFY